MKTSERIETEIEQTRGAMSDTLQAIERKFSPNRLVDEAMETMRNFSISNSPVLDVIRDNPLPLAVAGIGLGWLALATLRGSGREVVPFSARTGSEPAGGRVAGYGSGTAGGGNGSDAETTEDAEGVASAAAGTGGRVGRWTESVRHRAGDMAARGSDVFQDHPVAVGLMAAAAGLALGLAWPRGRQAADLAESFVESGRKTGRVLRQTAAAVGEGTAQTVQRAAEALRGESGVAH